MSVIFSCDYCGKEATERPSHYARRIRHFCSAECYAKYRKSIPKLFVFDIEIDDKGCWVWQRHLNHHGYGMFWNGEKEVKAHRLAYEFIKGEIPKGLELDHTCRNRACINPDHLEAVTHKENINRSNLVGKVWGMMQKLKTHCHKGHPYSEENTKTYHGRRSCILCSIEYARAYRERNGRQNIHSELPQKEQLR